MNSDEDELNSISQIMRVTRKANGLTQIEISKILGVSQSFLSKVEGGLLMPSAAHWVNFCLYMGISTTSFKVNFIDQLTKSALIHNQRMESGFKLPEQYQSYRASKVRELIPFLNFWKDQLGKRELESYLIDKGLDLDLFVNLDAQVNLNLFLDLVRELVLRRPLKLEDLSPLGPYIKSSNNHGDLGKIYQKKTNPLGLLVAFFSNRNKYNANFKYEVVKKTEKELSIKVTPEEHLKFFPYKDDAVLKAFLCDYEKICVNVLSQFNNANYKEENILIEESECCFRGGASCVYRISI